MRLLIGRHQQSVGNKNNIIQGKRHISIGLSRRGIDSAHSLIRKNNFGFIERIVTSPWLRCLETAKIYNKKLNLPLVIDSSLIEFNPGILGDFSKSQIKINHSNCYRIWLNRGDLDGIAGAERGDNLQARVLYFLEQYLNKTSNDFVITHAGFLRCLYNTILNYPRTKSVKVDYDFIHNIPGNPWDGIEHQMMTADGNTEVYKIRTADSSYILKKINHITKDELGFQQDISNAIMGYEPLLVPEIFFCGMRDKYAVQVLRYFSGRHIFGALSEDRYLRLIDIVYNLSRFLSNVVTTYRPNFKEKLSSAVQDINDDQFKKIGKMFFTNKSTERVWNKDSVLINYDLHRHNILFDQNKIYLLDFGSYIYGNKVLQAACLFSGFLFEDPENFNLNWLISKWPEPIDTAACILGIKARIFMGIAFFIKKRAVKGLSELEDKILKKYIKAMQFIL